MTVVSGEINLQIAILFVTQGKWKLQGQYIP